MSAAEDHPAPFEALTVQSSLQQTEVALQESEARFQAFMSNSPTSAWIADLDGRLLYLSPTYFKMFQFSQQDAVGKQIHEIYSPEFAQKFLENNRRVFQTGQVMETIETAPRPDGSIGSFLVYKFPIQASNEMLLGGVAIDITEHKCMEEMLRQREEQLSLITNALPVLIAYVDKDHYYRFNNQTYEAWFGQPAATFTNRHVRDVLGDATYQAVQPHIDRALSGQRVSYESQLPYRGGTRYIRADYVPHINTQGIVEGYVGLISDISAQKRIEAERDQVERALRRSEQRARLAIQVGRLGTWSYDLTLDLIEMDARMREIWGEPESAVTISFQEVLERIHPDDRERVTTTIAAVLDPASAGMYEIDYRIVWQDGTERWVSVNGQVQFAGEGKFRHPVDFFGTALDITDRKRAEGKLRESEQRLLLAQQAAGAGLWDWDIVTNQVTWSEEYYRLYGLETTVTPSYENWLATVWESDRSRVNQAICEALEHRTNLNVEFRTLHPTQGIRWITAIGQTFYDVDGQLTRMTGIALNITDRKQAEAEREQLLLREQAAREAAEIAEQRARFLVEVSTTLSSSLDYEHTLKSVAQAVVPTLADWCAVDILKVDGTLERLATAHVDPAKAQWGKELHRRYPPDLNAPQGIAQVLRTGKSEYYPTISDDQIVAAARDEEHLRILREVGFSSVMLVPLNVHGRTLGTISFVAAESGRLYSLDDLSLAEELARRGAIALDNARLYQEAQQARQAAERAADRTTRLQAVTAALSKSLIPVQVAEVIVSQSIAALEADTALMALCSEEGTLLEVVQAVGYEISLAEIQQQVLRYSPNPLLEVMRTGQPVWAAPLTERIVDYPHLVEAYQQFPSTAWISLPLAVEGKVVGGLSLSFKNSRILSQDDRDFVLALTRQCAQAIVRAQLYAAEQQARAEAEAANRIKDEFLAVLSHELRSPLNPILGWAKLLQTRQFDAQSTTRALETIERNAKLQAQLVEDLLDISRILRGKMVLNISEIDLVTVIDAAIETVRLSAEAKNIEIHKAVTGDVGLISGDSGRLQQVVWNLLSNAVKFTPAGGRIEICLEQVGIHAQIQVRDNGKGITPEFLPYVFEYFRQEDGTITRKFGGLGLGLAIVQYLTELHGGVVRVESLGEGFGATFTVLLPTAKAENGTNPDESSVSRAGADSFSLANLRILVVDDEADMRELAYAILEPTGAETEVAASAFAALDALDTFKPDILISDIGMPDMDGYELMRQVRNLLPEQGGQIPAIALTAYAGEINQQQALAAGFQRHLAKPVEPEALVKAIVALIKS